MLTRILIISLVIFTPLGGAWSDIVVETFDHPIQSDSTGFVDSGTTFYRITTTGTYGGAGDLYVATWSEGLSDSAEIQSDGGNRIGVFSTAAGSGFTANENILLGIVDFPGFGDTSPGGNFGTFFSTPQDLTFANGSVRLRHFTSHPTGATARFLALDADDNEVFTSTFGVNASVFGTHNFSAADFTNGDIVDFDETQVVGVGIEFFAQADNSGAFGAFQFDVDDLQLNSIPEPSSAALFGAVAGLLIFCRTRRRNDREVV